MSDQQQDPIIEVNSHHLQEDEQRRLMLVNPKTGAPRQADYRPEIVSPKAEQAIAMYTIGQFKDQKEAAVVAGLSLNRFNIVLNSPAGQAVVARVRGEQEQRYQNLYRKFVDVVEQALDHADPAVALAGANLFAKTQVGTKVKVELSAEDIVQQIINGTYQNG